MLVCPDLLQDKDMEKLQALGGVTGLAGTLQSHSHSGLDPSVQQGPASIEEHRRVYGANTMPPMPQKNFFMLCFENIQDPIILLLIAAALVRIGVQEAGSGARLELARVAVMTMCMAAEAACMCVYV